MENIEDQRMGTCTAHGASSGNQGTQSFLLPGWTEPGTCPTSVQLSLAEVVIGAFLVLGALLEMLFDWKTVYCWIHSLQHTADILPIGNESLSTRVSAKLSQEHSRN